MSDFFTSLDHLGPQEGSMGPSTGLMENFSAAVNLAEKSGTSMATESSIKDGWDAELQKAAKIRGKPFQFIGGLSPEPGGSLYPAYQSELAEFNDIRKSHPEIRSQADVISLVAQQARGAAEDAAQTGERATGLGTLGGFLGSIPPMFNLRRAPIEFGTMFLGGGGRTLAMKMLTEAAAVGGGQALAQYGYVEPHRAELGLPEGDPLATTLETAAFAGLFRGALHVGGRVAGRVSDSLSFRGALDDVTFSDPILEQMISRAPDTPTTRAARLALDSDRQLARENVYGNTPAAHQRLFNELNAITDIIEGVPRETALGRIPTDEAFHYQEINLAEDAVRQQHPELAQALDAAEAKHADLLQREQALADAIDNRKFSDSVAAVDEVSGQLVADIEKELEQPNLSKARRIELERRMKQITDELGPDLIAHRGKNALIGPKQELKFARRQRQAAQKEVNRLRREFGAAVERHAAEQAVLEKFKNRDAAPILPRMVTPEEEATRAAEVVERAPDEAKAIVENNAPPEAPKEGAPPEPKPAGVDIGIGENIPDDFTIEIDGVQVSAKSLMNDMVEDAKLEEIMRSCAL